MSSKLDYFLNETRGYPVPLEVFLQWVKVRHKVPAVSEDIAIKCEELGLVDLKRMDWVFCPWTGERFGDENPPPMVAKITE